MESNDPSVERRQREFASSGALSTRSDRNPSGLTSLSGFIKLMLQMGIDGPHTQSEIHLCGKHLGSGTQFDVYGHQHAADAVVPAFDQPFLQSRPPPSKSWRPVVIAIKRPRFTLAVGDHNSESSIPEIGFGTPSQLRALELEVVALCHEPIRNHRNIVKLLAWGFEDERNIDKHLGVEPLSPLLILEHGNCSLRGFLANDKGSIPRQVLQKLSLDVSQGLSILHASGVIHGDLKTDNILVFPDVEGPFFCLAKLSDFGLSVSDQKERVYDIGTPGWQAPELPSDDGIGAEMLVKCDCFSLGLLIFSIMLTDGGESPLGGSSSNLAFQLASSSLAQQKLPPSTSSRVSHVLECLLRQNPSERISDLEVVCRLLEQLYEEPFDSHGTWINGRFDDNTPWGSLFRSSNGTCFELGDIGYRQGPTREPSKKDLVPYSWLEIHRFLREVLRAEYELIALHYINGIDRVVSGRTLEEIQSMGIVGQEITGQQLLGLCFSDRFGLHRNSSSPRESRRLLGSCVAVSAIKGYFPAQAVALQLLEDTNRKFLEDVRSNNNKWQFNAVSTGYVLAWGFSHWNPEEHALALENFRMSGGYNLHYIYTENKEHLTYSTSGLLPSPLESLSGYPLHYAAALGDVSKIERLLGDHDINSFDASGETPLQRACMAGASSSVRCLIKNGADPTVKSKTLGTVPLHWLFVFKAEEISDIATLLTAKDKSVLGESSALKAEAFHFPFKWPVGTPLEWAVLSNRPEAVTTLLELGSSLDSITDFFPGPPNWEDLIYSSQNWDQDSTRGSVRELWRVWIYYPMEKFRLSIVQKNLTYQRQLESLSSNEGQREMKSNLHIFDANGGGLDAAVIEGDFDAVKQFIGMGVKASISNLATAIDQNNPDILQLLIDSCAKTDYNYLLRRAVSGQHLGLVKLLLDRGTELNTLDSGLGVVTLLLDRGTELNTLGGGGGDLGTVLYEAAKGGSVKIVKLLLQYGADPSFKSEGEMNALEAAADSNSSEIVELLLEKGANPNTPGKNDPQYQSALQAAARYQNAEILRALLDKGADPNIRVGSYGTALQAAIDPLVNRSQVEQKSAIQLLLERGADVTISGGHYGSIIQAVVCTKRLDYSVVKLLLDAGAPVDIGGGPHGSALQAAVRTHNLELVQLLLDYGADPDFGGNDKWRTPLQVAINLEDEKKVDLLLRRGADPNIEGGLYRNAMGTAEKSGNTKIIQMLLNWGARDEGEPSRWNSMLYRVSTPPLSHLEVSYTRFLLARCFERSTQYSLGGFSPEELAIKITGFAGYWLGDLSERHEKVEVSGNAQDAPYLGVKVKDWPSEDTRVCQVIFRIKSRDTAITKIPELHRTDPYQSSHTWFEAGVRSSNTADSSQSRIIIQKNFCGSLTTRTHNITWDLNSTNPQISRLLSSLKPGDVVDIYAKARVGERSYVNYVDSVEVIMFYGHTKAPISQSPAIEVSEKGPEPTPIKTEPPPPEIPETPGKGQNQIQTDTINGTPVIEEASTPKKSGFFGKFTGFFARCFK